jgi:hypothetical protein
VAGYVAAGTAQAGSTYPGGYTAVPNLVRSLPVAIDEAMSLPEGLLHDEYAKTRSKYRRPSIASLAEWIGSNRRNDRGTRIVPERTAET